MSKVLAFRVDEQAILKILRQKLPERQDVQARATSIAMNLFARAHSALMRDFFEHEITKELKSQGRTGNISNTLPGHGGDLFAFLGFWAGQDPTFDLEELLMGISIRKTRHAYGVINFRIENLPTKNRIKDATRMNWGNSSWVEVVEGGKMDEEASVAHFVFDNFGPPSRSHRGFQTEGDYSDDQFSPKPYMAEILTKFRARINESQSKYLV
jgi:hypothetical protein